MKLHGKIIGHKLIDTGKGKDAEAKEELVVTIRLDASDGGKRGRLELYTAPEDIGEYQLSDTATIVLDIPQQKLGLGKGGRASASTH